MPRQKKRTSQNKTYRIFDLYYPALITFIIFTIGNTLLQNVITDFSMENCLLIFLCLFIAIHLTGAYLRIEDWSKQGYPVSALISDCIDILCAVYICSAIVRYSSNPDMEISYLHLSIPFFIVSINQFMWFVFMRKFDIEAIFRICILFIGMLCISIIETCIHSKYSLIAIVSVIAILACLMIKNRSPKWFKKKSRHYRQIMHQKTHRTKTN